MYIFFDRHSPPFEMMIRVATNAMSLMADTIHQVRVSHSVFTNHEKRSMNILLMEDVQYCGCYLRDRTVVKCQIYTLHLNSLFPSKSAGTEYGSVGLFEVREHNLHFITPQRQYIIIHCLHNRIHYPMT